MDIPPGVRTVLIDGRSGAGKTTFAKDLGERWGWRVVHLDEFYPGWHGLLAGSHMVANDVLHLEQPGYRRWDWNNNTPGEWVALDPQAPLIVEGVGALTVASVEAARLRGPVLTVKVECPPEVRKERALRRDPDFALWWDMWAEQEEVLLKTQPAADVVIRCEKQG